jgi:PatG C-terminal
MEEMPPMQEVQPMQQPPVGTALGAPPVAPPVTQPPDLGDGQAVAAPDLPSFVFALGQVTPRFPSLAVEKEFTQVVGRGDNDGLTDREVLQRVLADRGNRYLVRQLCWVFLIEGIETYIVGPRDPADFDLLVEAVRPGPDRGDVDVVIGEMGPLAPPEACSGLTVPLVAFDQLYSFSRDELIAAIPRPESETPSEGGTPSRRGRRGGEEEGEDERFRAAARELFDRIMQLADNAGALDEHRALNYLAVRYPGIYATTADAFGRNGSLSEVVVRPSRLSGPRKIMDVIFSYRNRETDVTEKYFVRVDVTEKFPFLHTRMTPFYER